MDAFWSQVMHYEIAGADVLRTLTPGRDLHNIRGPRLPWICFELNVHHAFNATSTLLARRSTENSHALHLEVLSGVSTHIAQPRYEVMAMRSSPVSPSDVASCLCTDLDCCTQETYKLVYSLGAVRHRACSKSRREASLHRRRPADLGKLISTICRKLGSAPEPRES